MALTFQGNTSFTPSGPPRWIPGGLNALDALEVPYKGPCTGLNAFRDGLKRWSASTIDQNMFLETWPDNGHPQWPTVTLRFIGCKTANGKPTLPEPIIYQGSSLATASTTEGDTEVSVLYESPHTVYQWISTTEGRKSNGDPEYSGFSNKQPIVIKERRINGHLPPDLTYSSAVSFYAALVQLKVMTQADYDAIKTAVDARLAIAQPFIDQAVALRDLYFSYLLPEKTRVTEFSAKPIVPGKYWLCDCPTAKVLEPF